MAAADDAPAASRRRKPPGHAEQRSAHLIGRDRLIEAYLADEHAAVGDELDQPCFDECPERFPDRTAADLELLGEVVFVEPLSHGHAALQDHFFDFGA